MKQLNTRRGGYLNEKDALPHPGPFNVAVLCPTLCRLGGRNARGDYLLGAWAETAGPQQTIAAFNELHPDIKITYVQFANNDEGNVKLDTSLLSGQSVDVFYNYGDYRFAPRAENGMLLDLTDYMARDGVNAQEEFGNFYTYEGRFYGLPASSVQVSIYINKDMLDEAGLPLPPNDWTFDDWADYARKLTKGEGADRVYGTSDFHNDNNYWALERARLVWRQLLVQRRGTVQF